MRGGGLGRGIGRRRRLGRFWQDKGQSSSGVRGSTAISVHSVRIDPEKCLGCGNCARACPFNAVEIRDGKANVDQARCRGCRACVSACPTGAIT